MTPAPTMPDLLAERFAPLAKYCPNLATISRQQALFLLLDCTRTSSSRSTS